jgi:mannosyltransferase OCH1-like enzyme
MFWTDEKNRNLIATKYPWFLPVYDGYANGIQRADAVRYFILLEHGGVYADMDLVPLRSLEPMLRNSHAMLAETPNVGLTNAFMAGAKGSDFFKYVVGQLKTNSDPLIGRFSRHWHIMLSTGPTFMWKMASDYAKLKDNPNKVKVDTMPAWVWGKCKICKRECVAPSDGYFQHSQGDSWHHWDSWFFTHGLFCHIEFTVCLAWVGILLVDKHVTRWYLPFWNADWSVYYGACLGILLLF